MVGATVTLFATTGAGGATGGGTLYKFVDSTGYNVNVSGSASTIATAGTNQAFRGVALAPQATVPPVVPETHIAVLLPLTAGADLLAGAKAAIPRRRRRGR